MPELPEVETTCRGITPYLKGKYIGEAVVRQRRLRLPVTRGLAGKVGGQRVIQVARRGKYILLHLQRGCLLYHLGMSGSLRILQAPPPPAAHDHLDIVMKSGAVMRFRDPRRFGTVLWLAGDPLRHKLLAHLGPEPLGEDFTGDYLYRVAQGRRTAVKNLIMDSHIVVGVGNIYASEALFAAGIHPARPACRISKPRYEKLAHAIRKVLAEAITAGGTTLRDFMREDGRPGYFSVKLSVYHREGEACPICATPIAKRIIGQRASFYCSRCQR